MTEDKKTKLGNIFSMFDTWQKVCALILCIGVALGGLGFAVQQGAITPTQSQNLIDNINAELSERIDSVNGSLYTSWNPTVSNTNGAYSYMIGTIKGTGGIDYYYAHNGSDGGRIVTSFNLEHTCL
jgi:hypothetical protein